jgi:hypothetical protein
MTVYQERSASTKLLNERLAKAMLEFEPIVRDSTGTVVRRGKVVEYRFASLASQLKATKAALLRQGVVPRQEYCYSDEGITLVTTLNYGDEFITSVLPIRQYEDQQIQKAHMSAMRRAAYEGMLCLAADEDADVEDEKDPAQPDGNALWREQERLAKAAIEKAETVAEVKGIVAKVSAKVDAGDMDPHCVGMIEELAMARIEAIKPRKAVTA